MTVEVITSTPERVIGESATICYGSKYRDGLTRSLVHNHKHLAVLRFAFVVIKVGDISIPCQNQFVRSSHLDFLVESKRYVKAQDRGFVVPEALDATQRALVDAHVYKSKELYRKLIRDGVKKEDARAILPANTMTSLNASGNLQAWVDFLKLRLSSHAQAEIRGVALEIGEQLVKLYPEVLTDMEFEGKTLSEWGGRAC